MKFWIHVLLLVLTLATQWNFCGKFGREQQVRSMFWASTAGLPDFPCYKIPNWGKNTKLPQIYT
jgi:hypothetical protein